MQNSSSLQTFWKAKSKMALILDRDNTLTRDSGYSYIFDSNAVLAPALDFLIFCSQVDVQLHIATNQGGVALGKFSQHESERFNECLVEYLWSNGVKISSVVSCFHHPDAINELVRECECRKPKPGMLNAILEKNDILTADALMVGDSVSDVEAAEAAGIHSVRIQSASSWRLAREWVETRC